MYIISLRRRFLSVDHPERAIGPGTDGPVGQHQSGCKAQTAAHPHHARLHLDPLAFAPTGNKVDRQIDGDQPSGRGAANLDAGQSHGVVGQCGQQRAVNKPATVAVGGIGMQPDPYGVIGSEGPQGFPRLGKSASLEMSSKPGWGLQLVSGRGRWGCHHGNLVDVGRGRLIRMSSICACASNIMVIDTRIFMVTMTS